MPRGQVARSSPEIEVPDLGQFARDLRRIGDEFREELKDLNQQAGQMVVDRARSIASAPQQQAAAQDLRSRRRQREAVIALGSVGRSKAWARGAELGAKRWPQFPPWTGNQFEEWAGGDGYFLHPAIDQTADEVFEFYGRRLDEIASQAADFA